MRTKKQFITYLLSFTLLLSMIPAVEASAAKEISLSAKKLAITKGKSKTLKATNTQKKVTWTVVSGKQCVSLKKKNNTTVTVTGKKKGTAKVQAKTGKKKLTCVVTVKNAVNPANTSNSPQKQDVTALKAIIAEQNGRGATVSKDLQSAEYGWNDSGKLIRISWKSKNLSGDLDLSGLDALELFGGSDNRLSSLNVSQNVNLTSLECYSNQLSSLDVSQNLKLEYLNCFDNQLSSLDVSQNLNLWSLHCAGNFLDSLDVSKNTNLDGLACYDNSLGSLDVSQNTELRYLLCNDNQLSSLDVSRNVYLNTLLCENNRLVSLDLTNNPGIMELQCEPGVKLIGYVEEIG